MQLFTMPIHSSSMLSLLVLLLQILLPTALNHGYNRSEVPALIVFGDSIVDPGNNNILTTLVKCNFPPYGRDFLQHKPTGRFSNGKIPSDMIASALGIKELLPAYLDPQLKPQELLTGVSFASSGAGYDNLTAQIMSVLSLWDQLELFKEYIEKLKAITGEERAARIVSHSIYIVIIGTDDLANTYFGTTLRRAHYNVASYADFLVGSASSFYQELYKLGARKIGISGLPPIGCVPAQRTLAGGIYRDCEASYNQAAINFNLKLSKAVEVLNTELSGSTMVYIDIYTSFLNLIQRPFDYGFMETSTGCCGTGKLEVAIFCNDLNPYTCTDVSKYVFWDSYHPTEKAYKIIIDRIFNDYVHRLI
ncbi:GDSL esterase/lipase At1g58525-like isoform X1 [Tasmannia lanceolata]|uniref:GDSL esterase/lipase At1g58525-like isoform X1 n=1 Tax=Tasmannia lanceolata TaxID=3420 RepID=UPI00406467E2